MVFAGQPLLLARGHVRAAMALAGLPGQPAPPGHLRLHAALAAEDQDHVPLRAA